MTVPLGIIQMLQQQQGQPVPRAPVDLDLNARVQGRRTERPGAAGVVRPQREFLSDEVLRDLAAAASRANALESRSFQDRLFDVIAGKSTSERLQGVDAKRRGLLERLRVLRAKPARSTGPASGTF